MNAIQQAFSAAPGAADARIVMTGPGVFSVTSRDTIKDQVSTLSLVSMVLIAGFAATRLSLLHHAGARLPARRQRRACRRRRRQSGLRAVHGITLGFGTALIGEAVDYSIYLFVQSEQSEQQKTSNRQDWIKRFWPTIRLGVLTSICVSPRCCSRAFPASPNWACIRSLAGLRGDGHPVRVAASPAHRFRIRDVSALVFSCPASCAAPAPCAGRSSPYSLPPASSSCCTATRCGTTTFLR